MQQPNQIPSQTIRQIFLIVLIVSLGGIIYWQLKTFVPAFLGAYTFYILLRKWMFKLTTKLKGRTTLAAFLLMLGSFLVILVPLNGLIGILTSRIIPTIKRSSDIWHSLETVIQNLEEKYNIHILTQENLRNLGEWGVSEMQKVVGATFHSLLIVFVMYFILFFMLTEGRKMEKSFYQWLPFREQSITYLKKHLNSLVFSNAIGIPLVALLQGIVALIGYWLTGVQEPFIWFIATCVAAVIPVLGAALVYVPLSILLFANGMTTQAIILFLYGFIIVGSVDNLFRFWLQNKIGDTHPLITIFGVIVGLNLFGFIGLVFGPILLSLFLILLEIYKQETQKSPPQ
ncbi:MAG: AI-2E family transporter [Saprospiraceae bacterium]|nr:AI-2E family transporter [Saprospiraceae bacterium]